MITRICDTVTLGVFPPDSPSFQAQKPQRHQAKRDVVMPTHPTPNLVLRQADFAFSFLQDLLDPVPLRPRSHRFGQGDGGRCICQNVIRFRVGAE